ncbi:MAG TPA: Calx-beta domain-containing protein [Pyrinomonadaceae bacterium]|jgi:hypothetical protein|nr:Calx-beta domain-containing protein [Pyrinomonadaceae bacterium]
MLTRTPPRAAKRITTFAVAFAATLLLFCASGDVGSAQQYRRPTARPVNVAVADYTVTTTGGAIVVTDVSGNGDTLIVAEPVSGQIKFVAAGRTFSVDGGAPITGDSGNLTLSGINSITINQGGGNDTLSLQHFTFAFPNLKVNGDAGDDVLNFSGSIGFAMNASLDANLQDDSASPGTDSAVVASGVQLITSGTGAFDLRVSKSVIVGGLMQTQNGDLTIEANRQVTPTSGLFVGVGVGGGTIQTTGTGNVNIKGTGGAGDFTNNVGVQLTTGALVVTFGSGTISIDGVGGAGAGGATAGNSNAGVDIANAGTLVNSASGAIQITGQAGTTNDTGSYGVTVDGGKVETSGAGQLTINGFGGTVTGGSPTFVNSAGVFVVADDNGDGGTVASTGTGANAGAIIINGTAADGGAGAAQGVRVDTPGTVTSVDGSITFNGTAAACGNACLGTSIRGAVTATGSGAINVTGTGAASTGAFPTHGVNVRGGGNVASNDGDISITGTGGNGTDNAGFNLAPAGTGTIQTTGTGNVFVNANTMRIHPVNATVNVGAHAVSLHQKTNGREINLGSAVDSTANTVELSDAELDRINAGTINVGDSNSGTVNVSANITRAAATNLNLTSGGDINLLTGSLTSAGGNVSLNPGASGVTLPATSGVDVNAGASGTLTLASAKQLLINITGTTVDTGYTQLNVAGLVNLNGANLTPIGGHMPSPGQTFVVVNNDGADAITGTFNGLPEGATIPNFLGSSFSASISYVGGDGNDAVLTVNSPVTAFFSIDDVTHTEGNVGFIIYTFTITKSGTGAASVSLQTQDGTAEAGSDYSGLTGTAIFAANETTQQIQVDVKGDTTPELDETFNVVLVNTTANAAITDGTGVGTITNDDESVSAGQLIISEFRLSGPGAAIVGDGPRDGGPVRDGGPARGGAALGGVGVVGIEPPVVSALPADNDEFVELYNNTDHALLVTTTDGSAGWTVVASGGTELFFVPNGTVIPARGHYLGMNADGYSLGAYASGDTSWTGVDVPDNTGLALFRTHTPANYLMGTRLDAVGSDAEANALYREGTGYAALAPADIALHLEHAFYRELCSYAGGGVCATHGLPKDSGDNAADFVFVDTLGTQTAAGRHLGAPGPENLSSHVERNTTFGFLMLDATKSSAVVPNRERTFTPGDPASAPNGVLYLRRRVQNNTGAPVVALRFRIIELTTSPSTPGTADLRAISGEEDESVSGVGDEATCDGAPAPCTVMVHVTTLEQPPAQVKGGGRNSTLAAGTVSFNTPLADGDSVNLQFALGVVQGGAFRIYMNIEALNQQQVPQRPLPLPRLR